MVKNISAGTSLTDVQLARPKLFDQKMLANIT